MSRYHGTADKLTAHVGDKTGYGSHTYQQETEYTSGKTVHSRKVNIFIVNISRIINRLEFLFD